MRITPFITAGVVGTALFLVVIKRDAVMEFVGASPDIATEETVASGDGAPVADDVVRVPVIAIKSTATMVPEIVRVRGRTEAARQVTVLAETTGTVASDPLRKGTFVEAGQVMCELNPGTRGAALAQAEATLIEAQARLPEARARVIEAQSALSEAQINDRAAVSLQADGYASQTRVAATTAAVSSAEAAVETARAGLEAAQSGIRAAEAAVAVAEKEIEHLSIKAPFAGVLETDSAELGALLQAGSPCATVIQLDPIKLVGFVPETEMDKLTLNAMADAHLATGKQVAGEVTFLSRSADEATRTFRVEVEIPNPDLSVRDGQTVEMVLSSGGTQGHLLPQSALTLDDSGRIGVRYIDDQNMAMFTPVNLLRDTVEGVWLTGLPEQADVIIVGQEYVTDGIPVAPSYEGLGQ